MMEKDIFQTSGSESPTGYQHGSTTNKFDGPDSVLMPAVNGSLPYTVPATFASAFALVASCVPENPMPTS